MSAGRQLALFSLVPLLVPLAAGCRGPDLVTPDLRLQAAHIEELHAEIRHGEFAAKAADPNDDAARTTAYRDGSAASVVRRLVLAPATGGLDADGREGDEALRIALEPRDRRNRPVRAEGSLQIDVHQIGVTGMKVLLCSYDVPAEQLAGAWRADWSGSRYTLTFPWKAAPTTEQLRVTARLTLADGTRHETEREIRVRPGPSEWRPHVEPETDRGLEAGHAGGVVRASAYQGTPPPVTWEPTPLSGAVRLRRPIPLTGGL